MVFVIPRLTKCCCCIPLRIGSLIIGYFSLVLSLASLSIICVSLYRVVDYVRNHKNQPTAGHTTEEMQSAAINLYISHAYFIFVFLFCCAISLMLIVGVHRNNLRLVLYYVRSAMVLLVLELSLVVLTCVFFGVIVALPLLKWGVTLFCFIIVVRSLYLEMEDREKPADYMMYDMPAPRSGPSQQPLIYA